MSYLIRYTVFCSFLEAFIVGNACHSRHLVVFFKRSGTCFYEVISGNVPGGVQLPLGYSNCVVLVPPREAMWIEGNLYVTVFFILFLSYEKRISVVAGKFPAIFI